MQVGVKQGYGLSETSPSVTKQNPDEWMRFQGSVGKLLPNMSAKIVNEQGEEVAVGEVSRPFTRSKRGSSLPDPPKN